MKRSTWVFLAGVAVVVGLVLVELVSLGILGGGEDPAHGGGPTDLLEADGVADEAGATLKGRGSKTTDSAEDASAAAPDPFAAVPAEVRGSTKNGGSVRGRVVRKEGGVPLEGVRVSLGRPDSLITYLRAKANGRFDELEARTGPDGRFAFLDVTPSRGYVVRARHADFAITSHDETIDLSGRDAVDIGDLALGQGGGLKGLVVDAQGAPVADVRVAIAWRITNPVGIILADPDTAPEIEREVRTGEDGRFEVDRLDLTPKTILVRAPSGASAVVRSVTVEAGQTKAVDDIQLPGNGVIAGTVVWADGTPIQGARVFAAPRAQAAVRTVETGADGAFRIPWLPEGENYGIGAFVQGMPVHLREGVALGDESVRIEFPMPGALEGVVVEAGTGKPVSSFAIQLDDAEPPEDWQMRFVLQQVKQGLGPTPFAGPDGAFAFSRLATGTYHLTISAPGYPNVRKEAVTIAAGETSDVRIEVPRGHVASGIVRRSDGSALPGAKVFVVQGVPASVSGPNLDGVVYNRLPDAVTRGDGRFELPPQTPGTYEIVVQHPQALAGILRGVDLEAGDVRDLEVAMPPSATVRGRLLDEHARPAKGEQVYVVYRNGVARTTRTEDDGRFEIAGLPVGRVVVRWLSLQDAKLYNALMRAGQNEDARQKAFDDLAGRHGEHDLRDGAVVQVSLNIPRRVEVRGRYTLAGEPPAKGARFYVTIEGGGRWVEVPVSEEGTFETRLLPGVYLAYGPGPEGEWTSKKIEILEGQSQTLDIDM